MSKTLSHEIDIAASPEEVWAVLADTEAYPDWNPFVRELTGKLREGGKLEVRIAPPGGRPMTFKPVVLAAEPGRQLRWLGRLLVPGVFDGEHSFSLEPLDGGRTRFVQAERFSGILVRILGKSLGKTQLGFEQMNEALKRRVEARAAAAGGSSSVSGPAG
jgi:hypothetical protein